MLPVSSKFCAHILTTCSVVVLTFTASFAIAAAPTGGFLAVLSEQNQAPNGDSQRSVLFFDADQIGFGGGGSTGGPLFSVFLPFEDGFSNVEELGSITVDPATGDIFVLSYDSGNPADGLNNGDTSGTYDLYRIPFATVYQHWSTNFQGQNVRTLGGALTVGGRAPTAPNTANLDYVTYGLPVGDFGTGAQKGTITVPFLGDGSTTGHSNTYGLAGVVEKVGELARNQNTTGTSNNYPTALEFIDSTHLIMIDDDRAVHPSSVANDHDYRLIERVSTSPGAATSDGINGGYNGQTTQSWKATRIGQVLLDAADASEPESAAFYIDPISGVRGMWVTEGDFPTVGDGVGFLQLDNSNAVVGYRPYAAGASPLPSPLDNDPAVGNDNKGSADNVFVDKDSGDLIIVESGFGDAAAGLAATDPEPGVFRVPVNYDNGSGQIAFGTWSAKMILNPTKDPSTAPRLERGQWSTYDSANNIVYFFDPGDTGDTPQFQVDVYALDLDTGLTTSYMNVDDSISLFLGDGFGDKVQFFSFGLPGDFNGDGRVDAADYVAWRKGASPTPNSMADYNTWRANFGLSNVGAGGGLGDATGVPEPASAALFVLGLLAMCWRRRRA